ncbi:PEPxxWA-CTERM sorting domain-containing protein [Erythrobacter sp. sf7]|uniref:PEPxxWA-CTERM sorting domain-containing protein n=1 Tax=Erythrobacter fulvus TaxID=2987523 RepID=A0ABT5JLJ5_9SPHN|nr:PEPxxWA-CTERM sorting domain-containing protein [Erythrobacter fulvus]
MRYGTLTEIRKMWKSQLGAAFVAGAMLFAAPAAAATTVDVDTETATNWKVSGPTTPLQDAVVVVSPNPNWVTLPAGLKWISSVTGGRTSVPPGTYSFIYKLDEPGWYNSLSGIYWADNRLLDILINGVSLGTLFTADPFDEQFRAADGRSIGSININRQVSTIEFRVENTRNVASPMAFAFDGTLSVPEPGTWMLMILGLGAVGFAMRRSQKAQVRLQFA